MKASTPKTKAEKLAQKVWEDNGCKIPVDLEAITRSNNISVRAEDLEDDVSGMMITSESGTVSILVNTHHAAVRQNFSKAHELGHYFLHRAISPVFVDSKQVFFRDAKAGEGKHLQEIEANAFAAELLMPEVQVRALFPVKISPMELASYEDQIDQAASQFNVSKPALTIRLSRLGIASLE